MQKILQQIIIKMQKKLRLNKRLILLSLIITLLFSCSTKESPSAITYSSDSIDNEDSSNVVEIPFKENKGIRIIPVTINGVNMDMIFDTGASTTCISLTEALFLLKNGMLKEEDIIGTSSSQIADGSITKDTKIILREVVLDNKITFTNVQASVVHSMNAPLLLGNADILDKVASFKIDNENKTIKFTLK